MYAQIHSINEENQSSPGKTMRVWSDASRLKFSVETRAGEKHLIIEASCWDEFGSGERGGQPISINRTFYLQLEVEDIERLIYFILKPKILADLDIQKLQKADRSKKLQVDIVRLRSELRLAKQEAAKLRKLMKDICRIAEAA